jgi:hypothetical protein
LAFSKKIENHIASVALYMMYYNFGRKHQTLRHEPRRQGCEIIGLLEKREPKSTRAAISN